MKVTRADLGIYSFFFFFQFFALIFFKKKKDMISMCTLRTFLNKYMKIFFFSD
jgi:hypothetical protein